MSGIMSERVAELRAWANSRIGWCQREEQKFQADTNGANGYAATEAAIERRSLEAVLRILDGGND